MNLNFIEKIDKENIFKFFPELQILGNIIENNICHNNESVLNHTMQVFDNCKCVIDMLEKGQKKYFDKVITKNKIKDLFLLTALFHDIGKFETVKIKNSVTSCSNHEEIGTKLLTQTRLGKLNSKEFKYVQKVIKNHTLIQLSLDNEDDFDDKYSGLEKVYSDIILELTILGIADIYNGDLEKNNKQEYAYRVKKLSDKLKIHF